MIKPNEPSPATPQAWDVEVKVEDQSLKAKMNQVVVSMSSESARELAKLDEQVRISLFPSLSSSPDPSPVVSEDPFGNESRRSDVLTIPPRVP